MKVETKAAAIVWKPERGAPARYLVRYPVLERAPGENLLLVFADDQERFWGALNPSPGRVKAAALRYAQGWSLEEHGPFHWEYLVYRLTLEEAKALRRALIGEEKEGKAVVREAERLGLLRAPVHRREVAASPLPVKLRLGVEARGLRARGTLEVRPGTNNISLPEGDRPLYLVALAPGPQDWKVVAQEPLGRLSRPEEEVESLVKTLLARLAEVKSEGYLLLTPFPASAPEGLRFLWLGGRLKEAVRVTQA